MATPAEIQTQLDANEMKARIVRSIHIDGTYDAHCVKVHSSGGSGFRANRGKWCQTTAANTAAQQATAITNLLGS